MQIQREVKAKLPRRESERRNHALARHVDILSAVETRLSLLSMTYTKYMTTWVLHMFCSREEFALYVFTLKLYTALVLLYSTRSHMNSLKMLNMFVFM